MAQKFSRKYFKTKKFTRDHTDFNFWNHFWSVIGTFIGIGAIGLTQNTGFEKQDHIFLIGSFGATAVLVYGAPNSPFAQPRNLFGGHLLSAFIGVTIHILIPGNYWLAASLSVALSIAAMQMTKTMHPPGGATALIANIGSEKITGIGYGFLLSPVLSGIVILFVVALVVNNIPKGRRYPTKAE